MLQAAQSLGAVERHVVVQLFLDASHEAQHAAREHAARLMEVPGLAPIDFGLTASGQPFLVFAPGEGFDPRRLFSAPR